MPTSRATFQGLARVRIAEAQSLLAARHFHGAYYLVGYAVECGLKACIARRFARHELPDKELVLAAYTHKLDDLVKLAGLDPALEAEQKQSAPFRARWGLVKNWTEKSRYGSIAESAARDMVDAVGGRGGILPWIRRYW